MPFLIALLKDQASKYAKYILYFIVAIIIFVIIYKVNGFIKYFYGLKEANLILTEKLNQQEEKVRLQDITIVNYKKIFQKEFAFKAKMSKIYSIDSRKFNETSVSKINQILNCHIDNFKNLNTICE